MAKSKKQKLIKINRGWSRDGEIYEISHGDCDPEEVSITIREMDPDCYQVSKIVLTPGNFLLLEAEPGEHDVWIRPRNRSRKKPAPKKKRSKK